MVRPGTVNAAFSAMLRWNAPDGNPRSASSQTPNLHSETDRPLHLHLGRHSRTRLRIMACITSDAAAGAPLLQQAVLSASELDAQLFAVHVEGSREADTEREQTNRNLALARSLGAKVVRLTGHNVADCLLKFARTHGVKRIIVPRDRRLFSGSLFGRELWRQIVRSGEGFQIQIVGLRKT